MNEAEYILKRAANYVDDALKEMTNYSAEQLSWTMALMAAAADLTIKQLDATEEFMDNLGEAIELCQKSIMKDEISTQMQVLMARDYVNAREAELWDEAAEYARKKVQGDNLVYKTSAQLMYLSRYTAILEYLLRDEGLYPEARRLNVILRYPDMKSSHEKKQ